MAITARSTPRQRRSSSAARPTTPTSAMDLLQADRVHVSFDASAEAHIRLGIDPRHADQMVRGTVVLPHGTGKTVRVIVFAQGEKAQEALRGRRGRGRWRGPRQEDRGRLARFRRRPRDARHDGHRRPPGPHPRPARADAQPQVGHDHLRPRASDQRGQGWPRGVQGRQGRYHPHALRQGQLRAAAAGREPGRAGRRDQPRPAERRQGPLLQELDGGSNDGPGHPGRRAGGSRQRPPPRRKPPRAGRYVAPETALRPEQPEDRSAADSAASRRTGLEMSTGPGHAGGRRRARRGKGKTIRAVRPGDAAAQRHGDPRAEPSRGSSPARRAADQGKEAPCRRRPRKPPSPS